MSKDSKDWERKAPKDIPEFGAKSLKPSAHLFKKFKPKARDKPAKKSDDGK